MLRTLPVSLYRTDHLTSSFSYFPNFIHSLSVILVTHPYFLSVICLRPLLSPFFDCGHLPLPLLLLLLQREGGAGTGHPQQHPGGHHHPCRTPRGAQHRTVVPGKPEGQGVHS